MKTILILAILVAVLLIGFVVYRSRSEKLNVTPDAQREIERAKRR